MFGNLPIMRYDNGEVSAGEVCSYERVKMVSGPTSISSAPVMHFRPDPGEPAARLSAKESQSAGLVTLQEQRNETRLRMRAMSQGEDIIFSQRTFSLGLGSNSPTVNGGLTTVVTKPDRNGFLPDTVYQPQAPQSNQSNSSEETDETTPESQTAEGTSEDIQSAAQPSKEELDQKKTDVESENRQLERNLLRAQLEKDRAYQNGDAVQAQQADQKQADLERKIEDNEEEKKKVEQEQALEESKDFQQNTGQILSENVAAASSVLGVLLGGGDLQQAPSAPQVPRFSFAG